MNRDFSSPDSRERDSHASGYRARAHAKVNLHLGVGDARADGYHELATVFQSLELHDDVRLSLTGEEIDLAVDGWEERLIESLAVTGPYAAGVPTDSGNLVWRATVNIAKRLRAERGLDAVPQVAFELRKGIPAAGGMAGGSADAAAALLLADAAFGPTSLGQPVLYEEANWLGSDIAFTLRGGTALGTGRGEQLTPMLARGTFHWAIITSNEGLSTPAVFQKVDELRAAGKGQPPHLDTAAVSQALTSGDAEHLAAVLHNDMQPAALTLRPDLRKTLAAGKAAGALAGIVSGSGPTCALLCADAAEAAEVAAQVSTELPGTRGIPTSGPARGAHLVDEAN